MRSKSVLIPKDGNERSISALTFVEDGPVACWHRMLSSLGLSLQTSNVAIDLRRRRIPRLLAKNRGAVERSRNDARTPSLEVSPSLPSLQSTNKAPEIKAASRSHSRRKDSVSSGFVGIALV